MYHRAEDTQEQDAQDGLDHTATIIRGEEGSGSGAGSHLEDYLILLKLDTSFLLNS